MFRAPREILYRGDKAIFLAARGLALADFKLDEGGFSIAGIPCTIFEAVQFKQATVTGKANSTCTAMQVEFKDMITAVPAAKNRSVCA